METKLLVALLLMKLLKEKILQLKIVDIRTIIMSIKKCSSVTGNGEFEKCNVIAYYNKVDEYSIERDDIEFPYIPYDPNSGGTQFKNLIYITFGDKYTYYDSQY